MRQRTALWLSHHYPSDYERCVFVRGRHVCRRCAVLYPLVFATMFAALAGLRWGEGADPWLLWLLPVPVVAEWWGEQLGALRYAPMRNTLLTALCAPAVGVGLARYMADQGDGLFWAVVATYAVLCAAPVLIGWWRARTALPANREAPCRKGAGRVR